jgi:HEPN domain-containing protein
MPGLAHKRADLQQIAEAKLEDARVLFERGRYSNAYYLAGYAVEIGLKACIAKQVQAETMPTPDTLNKFFQHDLKSLVALAGLTEDLNGQQQKDKAFASNWAIAAEWDPQTRYEDKGKDEAKDLIDSVSVLMEWIRLHW